jgi:hypothetical protein
MSAPLILSLKYNPGFLIHCPDTSSSAICLCRHGAAPLDRRTRRSKYRWMGRRTIQLIEDDGLPYLLDGDSSRPVPIGDRIDNGHRFKMPLGRNKINCGNNKRLQIGRGVYACSSGRVRGRKYLSRCALAGRPLPPRQSPKSKSHAPRTR